MRFKLVMFLLLSLSLFAAGCGSNRLDDEIAKLNEVISDLQTQNAALNDQVVEYQAEILDLTNQAIDIGGQISDITAQLNQALSDLDELIAQGEDQSAQIANLQEQISNLTNQLNDINSNLTQVQDQITNLESELAQANEQIFYNMAGAYVAGMNITTDQADENYFEFIKVSELQSGWFIMYYGPHDQYYAINLNTWDPANDNPYGYADPNTFGLHFFSGAGDAFGVSPNGDGTFSGSGLTFETTGESIKDLELLAARAEESKLQNLKDNLAYSFGLSEQRANKIAKVATNFKKQSFMRSMTKADLENFSQEVMGISYNEMKDAFIDSDEDKKKNLIDQAASFNNISPEHAQEIIKNFFM